MGYSNSRLRGCVNWKEDGGTACVLREKRKERTQTQKGLFFFSSVICYDELKGGINMNADDTRV